MEEAPALLGRPLLLDIAQLDRAAPLGAHMGGPPERCSGALFVSYDQWPADWQPFVSNESFVPPTTQDVMIGSLKSAGSAITSSITSTWVNLTRGVAEVLRPAFGAPAK